MLRGMGTARDCSGAIWARLAGCSVRALVMKILYDIPSPFFLSMQSEILAEGYSLNETNSNFILDIAKLRPSCLAVTRCVNLAICIQCFGLTRRKELRLVMFRRKGFRTDVTPF